MYPDAESATPEPVFQLPRVLSEPTILMVWPTTVVTISSKVTATLVARVQVEDVVVVLELPVLVGPVLPLVAVVTIPDTGVWFAGNVLTLAVE